LQALDIILLVRLVAWVALLQSEENWRLLIAHRAKEIDDSVCMRPFKSACAAAISGACERILIRFNGSIKKLQRAKILGNSMREYINLSPLQREIERRGYIFLGRQSVK
jgi:hypothetical protein